MKYLFSFALVFSGLLSSAQFVARLEAKQPIPGVCDMKNIIVLFPMFKDQEPAICPVSEEEIQTRLNSEIKFLSDNPNYNDEGMIGIVLNCKGKVVKCKMDNKTKSEDLDREIEAVFNSLGEWKPGKLNGKKVDTSNLFSFTIKDGRFILK